MSIVGDQSIMVKVSVIIPVYNVEPYLKQCMDSVVGQTLKDIEIICVDDGSTDGSLDILRVCSRGQPYPDHRAEECRSRGSPK